MWVLVGSLIAKMYTEQFVYLCDNQTNNLIRAKQQMLLGKCSNQHTKHTQQFSPKQLTRACSFGMVG